MQLIFHDRRPLAAAPIGEPWLTIERKGTFSLSTTAATLLRLKATDEVVLVQDAHNNTWYLLPNPQGLDVDAFEFKPRDRKGKALTFCALHRARAYYQAHGLGEEKSVRSLVAATVVEHEGLQLYPLTPQHATKTPVTAAVAAPAQVASPAPTPASAAPELPAQPDVAPLEIDLPHLQPEPSAVPPLVASAPVPSSPRPAVGALPESRAEQLADYWHEREISLADASDLEEILKVLGNTPKSERGFTENIVLGRAKSEQAKRLKEAGKEKGGKRG